MALPINLPQKSYIKGFWRFEETSGTNANDSSGNSHTGTASRSNILNNASGKIGLKAVFAAASSDKITIVDHADLKPTGNFSISVWFLTSTTGTYKMLFQSYALGSSKVAGIRARIESDNKLYFSSGKNSGLSVGTDWQQKATTGTYCDGNWHNVICTWDGSNLNIYMDNGAVQQVAWVNAPAYQATNYVRIGTECETGSDSNYFNGSIDEVILWNGVALSSKEVAQVYSITAYRYAGGAFLLNLV